MTTEHDTSSDDSDDVVELSANAEYATGLRAGLAAALGQDGFNDRDLYDTFGWPENPSDDELFVLGLRNAVAWTVINKPALSTWRDNPQIKDGSDREESEFEASANKLNQLDAWNYCERIDRLAGYGEHGVLVLNLSDTSSKDDLETEASSDSFTGLDDIQGFRVYPQVAIDDIEWGQPGTERWGQPVEYTIDLGEDSSGETEDESGTITVHHSRVIDVPATRLLDDETKARPRHEAVLNNIYDIEKTLGSAAEQSYRGADYGLAMNVDPEKVGTSDQDMEFLESELQDWYHGLQPYIRGVGAEVERLGGEMQDPSGIIDNELSMVAMQTGIPKNELTGNRQGEVSGSEEDKKSYFGMISERREQYATPHLVRSLVDRLRDLGILPEPSSGSYEVKWPDLHELSEKDEAEIQAKRAQAAKQLQSVIPGRSGADWEAYVEEGEFPERDTTPVGNLDEGDPRVQEEFSESFGLPSGNARRYSEGDVVQTPQGVGVVVEVRTKSFEGKDGEVDASESSPTYVVGLKDERVGVGFYSASELSEGEIETDVANPVEDAGKVSANNAGVTANDWSMPESWRDADTPARLILLDAWASMGGTFTKARQELGSARLAAAMKDEVLQWEGWRRGGSANAATANDWTPSLHPRDDEGKFTEKPGGGFTSDALSNIGNYVLNAYDGEDPISYGAALDQMSQTELRDTFQENAFKTFGTYEKNGRHSVQDAAEFDAGSIDEPSAPTVENAGTLFSRMDGDTLTETVEWALSEVEDSREADESDKKRILRAATRHGKDAQTRRQIYEDHKDLLGSPEEKDYYEFQFGDNPVEDRARTALEGWVEGSESRVGQLMMAGSGTLGPNEDTIPYVMQKQVLDDPNPIPISNIEPTEEMREVFDHLHKRSQEYHGGETVTAYRGVDSEVTTHSNVESWTQDAEIAEFFDGEAVLEAEISAEHIIASEEAWGDDWPRPENVNKNEQEVLVYGGGFQ